MPTSVIRMHNGSGEATIAVAPVQKGAGFTPLLDLGGSFKTLALPIPTGDGCWFVVQDVPLVSGYRVWRIDAGGASALGTLDDPLLAVVAEHYRRGSPALEGGSLARDVICSGETCRSGLVDLATPAVKPLGSVPVPGATQLSVAGTRWLACDTVEVIAVEPPPAGDGGPGTGLRLYRMRLAANAPL
jgi:hypothetical protein